MAVKHLLTQGIGLSPGSVRYIVTLGLEMSTNITAGSGAAITAGGATRQKFLVQGGAERKYLLKGGAKHN